MGDDSRRKKLPAAYRILIPLLIQFRPYQDPVTGFYAVMQVTLAELRLTVYFLLRYLREQGVDPRRIVGLLGMLAGLDAAARAVSPAELLPAFDWGRLPRQDVRLRNSHLRGLL